MSTAGLKHVRSLSSPKTESSMDIAKRVKKKFYRYEPLQNLDSDIRILKLLPSDESDEICCCFETQSLDDKPFYLAASYEWGEPEPQVEIRIDGKRFSIRLNLWLFLQYLQTDKQDVVRSDHFRLWVDAICIDQRNISEKNAQVKIMSRIFTQADSVFAWLGWNTSLDTKTIFRFIREASFYGQLSLPEPANEINQWFKRFVQGETDTSHFCHIPLLEMWKGVVELSNLSYWSRRWIVQEVLFARKVTILLDSQELPWTALELLFGRFDRQRLLGCQENIRQTLDQLQQTIPWTIWRHRTRRAGSGQDKVASLRSLLKDFRHSACTVLHDRVYALISLSTDGHSVNIDYSCPMIDVFTRFLALEKNKFLNTRETANLATELGLSRKPRKLLKKDAGIFRNLVGYCRELSSLVRVISVRRDPRPAFEFITSIEEGVVGGPCRTHVIHLHGSCDNLSFDTNLVNSHIEHSLDRNAKLKDGMKLNIQKRKGKGNATTLNPPSSNSESSRWSFIVCDDCSIGWSCPSILPGDFLWPISRRLSLVLRYHSGVFKIIGAASTMRLGSPAGDLEYIMSSHVYGMQKQYEQLSEEGYYPTRLASMALEEYHELMKSLWRGNFNYTWVTRTESMASTSPDLTEAAFVWRSGEGGRVRLFPGGSSQGDLGLKIDGGQEGCGEARFAFSVEPTSSVNVMFDAWELIAFAQQFECLEEF